MFKLLTDSLLYLYVILIGFPAVNTELSVTTRQVPCFIQLFYPLSVSGQLTGTLSDRARDLSQLRSACCVLGVRCRFCVNRREY
jgi:hypothetical protein